jgi:hypothetical protein
MFIGAENREQNAALPGDIEPRKLKMELASSIDSKKCGI